MYIQAKTKPYRNSIALTMKGVKKAKRKFMSQFDAVASAPCFARVRVGNVSPIRIHTPGAQVMAYPKINMQAETIISFPMPWSTVGSLAVPAAAKTNNHAEFQIPPTMRGIRRPN